MMTDFNPAPHVPLIRKLPAYKVGLLLDLAGGRTQSDVYSSYGICKGTMDRHLNLIYRFLGVSGIIQTVRVMAAAGMV